MAQEVYPTEYEIQYSLEYSIFADNLDTKQTEVLYLFSSPQTSVFMNHNKAKADEIEKNIESMIASGSIDMSKYGQVTTDFPLHIYNILLTVKQYIYQT